MSFDAISVQELGIGADLRLAASYRREVRASIERVWENVFDWEHLPVLHEGSFKRVELLRIDAGGWRVELTPQPGDASRMQMQELEVDRANARYRVTTLAGTGTGTRVHTLMRALGAHTAIEVRYYVPEHRPERLDLLGAKYRKSSERLWDEDEAMMMRREQLMSRRRAIPPSGPSTLNLGSLAALREALPRRVEFSGRPFRIVEVGGELLAHATECPHWLGPLDDAPVRDGCVRCPWHGYRFDVRSGASVDGRGLQLAPAARVVVDAGTQEVTLVRA